MWRTDLQIGHLLSHPVDGSLTFVDPPLGLPEPPLAIMGRNTAMSM